MGAGDRGVTRSRPDVFSNRYILFLPQIDYDKHGRECALMTLTADIFDEALPLHSKSVSTYYVL